MTLQHDLSINAGRLRIQYEWHSEMAERRPNEKYNRFKAIWTIIHVPVAVLHSSREAPLTEPMRVEGDWCSPATVLQLVRAYIKGMELAISNSLTDASDAGNVLTAMEEEE